MYTHPWLAATHGQLAPLSKGHTLLLYNQVSLVYPFEPVKQSGPSDQCSQINQKYTRVPNTMVPIEHPPHNAQLRLTLPESVLQHNKQSKSILVPPKPP